MKYPGLGPKAKLRNKKKSTKLSMRRKRAEERHDKRGSDSNCTDVEEEADADDEDTVAETPEMEAEEGHCDTPKPPKAKKARVEARRNINDQIAPDYMAPEFDEDPYLTLSEKDDSDFGTDGSLSDQARDTEDEGESQDKASKSPYNSDCPDEESELSETSSDQDSDEIDEIIQNPWMYPPSQPIPYDRVETAEIDPAMEFFRAVVSVKVRHDMSDAGIDDLIKVGQN